MPRHKESAKQRSRSRSPHSDREGGRRSRSSPHGSSQRRHRHRTHRSRGEGHQNTSAAVRHVAVLPNGASALTKDHFHQYEALFAQYLDIQKQLDLSALEPAEARGRWKSFIKKWNRRELAEGWYDPDRLQKARALSTVPIQSESLERDGAKQQSRRRSISQDSSDDEGPGPYLARSLMEIRSSKQPSGPSVPTMQDLELKKEQEADDSRQARSDLRWEQRANRTQEKERLEEVAPKAMAGTKERQMEKKREQASANRSFAEAKAGDMAEVGESELMGGGDEGIDAYKKKKKEMERQKTEREVRREEIMRAKQEERQQRAREIHEKEDRTMQGLLELARQRFG